MNGLHLLDCFEPEAVKLERVRYFQRQLLTAEDMETDQEYFRQKLRRHNRFLHGWGAVCGLEVLAAPTQEQPWRIEIEPGYFLGPYGDEGYVAKSFFLDLADCGEGAETDPCDPETWQKRGSGVGGELFIAIKYAQCKARPVKAMPPGCGCDELPCEYSRIRDSYQVECLSELPPSHLEPPPEHTLCDYVQGLALPPCPPCPADPWVVLAKVTLPASPTTNLEESNIDNFVRRQIFSTAILQQQLIECCCEEREPPIPTPPIVISITGPNGVTTQVDTGSVELDLIEVSTLPLTRLEIRFDKRLQLNTVNSDTVQVESIRESNGQEFPENVPVSVSYLDSPPTAVVEGQFLENIYRVTVYGNSPKPGVKPIQDVVDNLTLDGNRDGVQGGNFSAKFQIIQLNY